MEPEGIVRQVMEREFPGAGIVVTESPSPTFPGGEYVQVFEAHFPGTEIRQKCAVHVSEPGLYPGEDLAYVWELRASAAALVIKERLDDASHGRLVRDRTERPS